VYLEEIPDDVCCLDLIRSPPHHAT
jgi:hypothetical protein